MEHVGACLLSFLQCRKAQHDVLLKYIAVHQPPPSPAPSTHRISARRDGGGQDHSTWIHVTLRPASPKLRRVISGCADTVRRPLGRYESEKGDQRTRHLGRLSSSNTPQYYADVTASCSDRPARLSHNPPGHGAHRSDPSVTTGLRYCLNQAALGIPGRKPGGWFVGSLLLVALSSLCKKLRRGGVGVQSLMSQFLAILS